LEPRWNILLVGRALGSPARGPTDMAAGRRTGRPSPKMLSYGPVLVGQGRGDRFGTSVAASASPVGNRGGLVGGPGEIPRPGLGRAGAFPSTSDGGNRSRTWMGTRPKLIAEPTAALGEVCNPTGGKKWTPEIPKYSRADRQLRFWVAKRERLGAQMGGQSERRRVDLLPSFLPPTAFGGPRPNVRESNRERLVPWLFPRLAGAFWASRQGAKRGAVPRDHGP